MHGEATYPTATSGTARTRQAPLQVGCLDRAGDGVRHRHCCRRPMAVANRRAVATVALRQPRRRPRPFGDGKIRPGAQRRCQPVNRVQRSKPNPSRRGLGRALLRPFF